MNYRRNEDKWPCYDSAKPLYNAVLDLSFGSEGAEELTLAEVKRHLLIDELNTDHDNYLSILIPASRRAVEKYTGRSIVRKTMTVILQNQLGNIELPYGPVVDITSVKDIEGNDIDADSYEVRGESFKYLETRYDWVKLTYTTAYDVGVDPTVDPGFVDLLHAVLCEIAWRFEHRGDEVNVGGLSPMAKGIAAQYRRQTWLA